MNENPDVKNAEMKPDDPPPHSDWPEPPTGRKYKFRELIRAVEKDPVYGMQLHNIVRYYWDNHHNGAARDEALNAICAQVDMLSADELHDLGFEGLLGEQPDWGIAKCSNNTKWHMLAFLRYV